MDTFQALADPNRRSIVELLAKNGQLSASNVYSHFKKISHPAVSQHLQVLKDAELVLVEKRAQQRLYSLNSKKVNELSQWVDGLVKTWEEKFDRMDKVLDQMKKESKEKICSRGHKFTGSGPCPVCWPGRLKKGKLSS